MLRAGPEDAAGGPMSSPEELSLYGRIGAYAMHARHDSRKTTAKARAVFLSRFEREVDPEGVLPPEERARRAEYAKRAYFSKLALKSAQSRRMRAAARKGGGK
jgi:hypothetical protein